MSCISALQYLVDGALQRRADMGYPERCTVLACFLVQDDAGLLRELMASTRHQHLCPCAGGGDAFARRGERAVSGFGHSISKTGAR